ncbi:MAG: hypothetical protein DMF64_10035 [Acidobacteria bacterium]|nr:MAG: hypothetical protein DMF64_10035 [Acidobacteriota bacterium]
MISYISLGLCVLILAQGCSVTEPTTNQPEAQNNEDRILKIKGINKEEAVAIANKDAQKDYKSLAEFNVIPCEQVIFWRIIYDGGGPEYVIDKHSGLIIRKQKIPQDSAGYESIGDAELKHGIINKQEAIRIAREDAVRTFGDKVDIDQFVILACEQAKVWRIIFDYKLEPGQDIQDLPHSSFPKYVIDKKTGDILYRELS